MENQRPVVIIGAGPAGIAAAMAAASVGPTILLDERAAPGGRERWPDDARDIRNLLDGAGVDYRPRTSVWAIFPGPVVAAYDATRVLSFDAGAMVIATGSVDRTWPVPGWDLDGVLTVCDLSKAIRDGSFDATLTYGILGHGDAADAATSAIEAAGGKVTIVNPALDETRIEGETTVEGISSAAEVVDVDRVVLALGRRPDPALALQARAISTFDRDALIDMPLLAADGATSLPGVFVAGEAAGRTTLAETRDHGAVAGTAAAAVASGGEQSSDLRAPVLAMAVSALPIPTDPTTVVCREQGVSLEAVRAAIDAGAWDVNDLRRRTRAGMGWSGGGDVLPVLASLLVEADPAVPDERLAGRHRPPARPLPFNVVLDTPGEQRQ